MPEGARPIDPEELLSHAARLRALARSLLVDTGRADDVVQQALVVALERPPRGDVTFGPWLVGVVRNLARRSRRAESRRSHHEAAVAPPAGIDAPDQIAARSEALRNLADAVHRLDPIYRDVVVLHYFDGLAIRDVAARLESPPETIRTRLKRALAQLRERLDADRGGDRRAWCAALLPFVARSTALSRSAFIEGSVVVTTKTKVLAACAALALIAVSTLVAFVDPDTRAGAQIDAVAAESVGADPGTARVRRAPEAQSAQTAATPLPGGTAAVMGAVCVDASGRPVGGQRVVLLTANAAATATTDERGAFRFERLSEDCTWRVQVDVEGFAAIVIPDVRLARDEMRDLGLLRLVAPSPLIVLVRDWGDHPIAGAAVEVHAGCREGLMFDAWTVAAAFRASAEPAAKALSDANGRAEFVRLPSQNWFVLARADGFVTGTFSAFRRNEVTFHLDRGLSLDGVLLERDRRPVAGATVYAAFGDRYMGMPAFPSAVTDAAGRFRLSGMTPGEIALLVARKGTLPADATAVRVPVSFPVEIVLDGGGVEGRVTSSIDGSPIAGARVMAEVRSNSRGTWVAEGVTRDDGTYRIDTVCAGDVAHFRIERQGFAATAESGRVPEGSLVLDGGVVMRDFTLGPGVEVTGRVTGPSGPMAGVRVGANRVVAQTLLSVETWSDADGRFALEHVGEGAVLLEALATGFAQEGMPAYAVMNFWAGRNPSRWLYDVGAAGLHDVEIVMTTVAKPSEEAAATPPTVRVSGRVTSQGGGAVAGASVCIVIPPSGDSRWEVESLAARVPVADDGRYEAVFPPRGSKFSVRAAAPGFAPLACPSFEFAADRTSFEADLVLAPLVQVRGRLVSSEDDGVSVAGARLALLPGDWKRLDPNDRRPLPVTAVSDAGGRFLIDGVAAGDAKLDVTCEGFVHEVLDFPAMAGSEITLRVEPAKTIEGVVRLAGGAPLAKLSLVFRRGNDERVDSFWWTTSGDDGRFRVAGLPSGNYEVTTAAGRDITRSVRFTKVTGVQAGRKDVEIVVAAGGEIAGRVLGPDGAPMSGVVVGTWSETGDRYTPSAVSQDDGTFVIRGLADCTYRLYARPPDPVRGATSRYPSGVLGARLNGVAPGSHDVEIRMPAGSSLRGVVIDASGMPVANAVVQADLLPRQDSDPWLETARHTSSAPTDGQGRFSVTGLCPAHYRLVHVPEPGRPEKLRLLLGGEDVVAGATDVRLVAGRSARISGVVLDEEGHPVAGAGVGARPQDGGPWIVASSLADGSFVLDGVSDLVTCVVSASKDELRGETAGVAPGASGVRVVLLRGLEASGRVLQKDGTPFAKSYVELALEDGDFRKSVPTDADGRFTAKGLRPGLYRVEEVLTVIRPGDSGKPRSCGTIRAGESDVELRLAE